VGQLNAWDRALRPDERGNAGEGRDMAVLPEAKVGG
jgi:hypothetical protein